MKTEMAKRLVLGYSEPNKGSYSFRDINVTAEDTHVYNIGMALNSLQSDTADTVSLVQTFFIV